MKVEDVFNIEEAQRFELNYKTCHNCGCEVPMEQTFLIEDFGEEHHYCRSCYNHLSDRYMEEAIDHPIGRELVKSLSKKHVPKEMNILGHYDAYRSWCVEYKGIYAVIFDGMCDDYWTFVRLIDEPFYLKDNDDICCKCGSPFDLEALSKEKFICEECSTDLVS